MLNRYATIALGSDAAAHADTQRYISSVPYYCAYLYTSPANIGEGGPKVYTATMLETENNARKQRA